MTSPGTESTRDARFLPLMLVLFVGSGCAALIYEIVWFQLLQLVIGSSAVSLGVLLGTFMGGMCLGSIVLPQLISARRHPLRQDRVGRALDLDSPARQRHRLCVAPSVRPRHRHGHGVPLRLQQRSMSGGGRASLSADRRLSGSSSDCGSVHRAIHSAIADWADSLIVE